MSSTDALKARWYAKKGVVRSVGTDTPVALRLHYIGAGTVTSVTTVTGTSLATITSDGGGTTKTYLFATYTTIAALKSQIEDDGLFEVKVLDALLADATATQFVDGAITAGNDGNGNTVYDVLADTSAQKQFTATLSFSRDFPKQGKLAAMHRVNLQEFVYFITLGGAGGGNVVLTQRVGSVESTIYTDTSISATKEDYTFASGFGQISSPEGGEIIVRVKDGTSITDASANYLRLVGTIE